MRINIGNATRKQDGATNLKSFLLCKHKSLKLPVSNAHSLNLPSHSIQLPLKRHHERTVDSESKHMKLNTLGFTGFGRSDANARVLVTDFPSVIS